MYSEFDLFLVFVESAQNLQFVHIMFVFLLLRGDLDSWLETDGKLTVLEGKTNILSVLWMFCPSGLHASQL